MTVVVLLVVVTKILPGRAFGPQIELHFGGRSTSLLRALFASNDNELGTEGVNLFSCSIISNELQFCERKSRSKVLEYHFHYLANVLDIPGNSITPTKHRVIVLIHPIGVGIGRWYYDRLLAELEKRQGSFTQPSTFIAPDLLVCGTASDPEVAGKFRRKLPLFSTKDWSSQVIQLIKQYEASNVGLDFDWVLLSNGGCVPIALDAAAQVSGKVSQIILSAPPRISGLLRESPPIKKVHKAYRRLSGVIGRIFWWYALRKNGRFIQKFSEKNLAADPASLGDAWTPTCVETCHRWENSRFSTFAFLAGALQLDCRSSLESLKSKPIDVITGGDGRRNPAKSWFWDKIRAAPSTQTVSEFLQGNGNGGRERTVGGRRCPAHEDAAGFADALIELIESCDVS